MRFWRWLTRSRSADEVKRVREQSGLLPEQEVQQLLAQPAPIRTERNSHDEHYYKQLCDHLEGGYVRLMRLRAQSELRRRKA